MMTYINLINWLAMFLVIAYTTFGLFVLHDEKQSNCLGTPLELSKRLSSFR